MKLSKTLLDKYVVIDWIDPQTFTREELTSVEFAKCQICGKVVQVSPSSVILQHDSCKELGDYTIIHPALITEIKKLS